MMPELLDDMAKRRLEPVFIIGMVQYVPHYTRPDLWVGLEGIGYSGDQMLQSGGVPDMRALWPRQWTNKLFTNEGCRDTATINDLIAAAAVGKPVPDLTKLRKMRKPRVSKVL
jgi:hypothetical protein